MVATVKSWSSLINNSFSSSVDQVVQYQEAFYNLKSQLLLSNWTLLLSCDGTTADASDNLSGPTDVTIGSEGSENISYFVVQSPSGWVSGGNVQVLVYTDNANADTTPQDVIVRATTGTYALDASPLQNRPTASGGGEVSWTALDLIPHAAAAPGRWHAWRTSSGDLIFGVSTDSTSVMETALIFWAPTPSQAPFNVEGDYRCAMFQASSALGALKAGRLSSAGNWRSFQNDNSAVTTLTVNSFAFLLTLFTNGKSSVSGALSNHPIIAAQNASDGRLIGIFEDLRSVPNNAPEKEVNDADGDATRYTVVDDLIIPTVSVQLPISL